MGSKQLHKHALPILVLSIGLLLVSVIGVGQFVLVNSHSTNSLGELLAERFLSIKPAANGLFHISRYQASDDQANSQLPAANDTPTNLAAASNTGKSTELDAMMSSLNQ